MNKVGIQARVGDQFLMSTPLDNVPAIEDQDLVGIAPVSYTHLDVYKRQAGRLGTWGERDSMGMK